MRRRASSVIGIAAGLGMLAVYISAQAPVPGPGVAGGAPPVGTAGGDLGGTYPNPTVITLNNVTATTSDGSTNAVTIKNAAGTTLATIASDGTVTLGSNASGVGVMSLNNSSDNPCLNFKFSGTTRISECGGNAGINFTTPAVGRWFQFTTSNALSNGDPNNAVGSIVGKWNDVSNVYRGLAVNVTDTASAASSMLADLQIGGVSKFSVSKAGVPNVVTGGSTTISTGVGSVKLSTANAATNAAWIPVSYAGTTYFLPAWSTNAP